MSALSAARAMGDVTRLRLRLTNRRKETNLSQQDIADRCGVTRETVGRWERGESTPKAVELSVWCAALDFRLTIQAVGDRL